MRKKYFILFVLFICACVKTMRAEIIECVQIDNLYYDLNTETGTATLRDKETGRHTTSYYTGTYVIPECVEYNDQKFVVTAIAEHTFCMAGYSSSWGLYVTLPKTLREIGRFAFSDARGLTSIVIPEGVTTISYAAFDGCEYLRSVKLPSTLRTIEAYAFYDCYLTEITFPPNLKSIGAYAFKSHGFEKATIFPHGLQTIGTGAFETERGDHSTYVIPSSVTSIGEDAFFAMNEFRRLYVNRDTPIDLLGPIVSNENPYYTSVYVPCGTKELYETADYWNKYGIYESCMDNSTLYNIETTANNGTVTGSGQYPYGTYVTLTGIPSEGYKFTQWSDGLVCNPRTEAVTADATYTAEFIEAGNIDPTWQILYTSSDGNVVTPNKTDVFGANIVRNTYQDGQGIITFDGPVKSIGNEAFDCCSSLASITIPEGVTTIGAETFLGCTALTSITIPSSVISIGDNAFYYCSALTSISLPESLISIGQAAFRDCSSLTSITLPESLTSIGEAAFYYCSALHSITIPEGITSIQNSTFYYCSALTSITLPESLTNIGEWAFRSCSALTSITIPEGVTSIQNSTFFQCSDLTSITLPKSLTSIGEKAFYRCVSLTSIIIPESVTSIGEWAFRLCSSLTTITIPSSVTSIGESAFYRCDALTSVTCKATTPPTLGEDVFNNIDNTIPVYVPCGSISAYKAADLWNYFTNFQSSEQFAMAVHSNNDTWGQVSITQPTIPYVGFTATADNSSIRMVYGGTLVGCIPNLQYSYDGQSWKKLEEGTNYNVEKGQTIYMRGHNPNGVSRRFDGYSYFDMKGSFEGSGDIMTLVDSTGATTTAPDYCFYRLFRNCTSLTKAPRLTATTINYQAYVSMFSGCTKLQHIEVDFTAWSSSATESWVSSVAPTGTFVKPTSLSTSYGSSYIPSGWTVLDKETNDSGTSNVTSGTYECETTLILTATPNDCYQFTQWSDGNTDNPRTIVVNEDATYTAEFMPIPYTIIVESADESQGSVQVEIN